VIQLTAEEYEVLHADALRYRGMRLIVTEPDPAKLARMTDAMDEWLDKNPFGDAISVENFDHMYDEAIRVANEVRANHVVK
jgi:hypothetical protein